MLGDSNISSNSKNFKAKTNQNGSFQFDYGRAANYLDPLPGSLNVEEIGSNGFPNSIGEYGMGRLMGRGAFGSVYEVTEIRHKTPLNDLKYAIKIVNILACI